MEETKKPKRRRREGPKPNRCATIRILVDRDGELALREAAREVARARTLCFRAILRADILSPPPRDEWPMIVKTADDGTETEVPDWSKILGSAPKERFYRTLREQYPKLAAGIVSAIDEGCRIAYRNKRPQILLAGDGVPRARRNEQAIPVRGQDWRFRIDGEELRLELPLFAADRQRPRFTAIVARRNLPEPVQVLLQTCAENPKARREIKLKGYRTRRGHRWKMAIPYYQPGETGRRVVPGRILVVTRPKMTDPTAGFLVCEVMRENEAPWRNPLEYLSAVRRLTALDQSINRLGHQYRTERRSGKKGHGRARYAESLIGRQEAKAAFKAQRNRDWAHEIVETAVRMCCESIIIEDIGHAGVPADHLVLGKQWTYYDLLRKELPQRCADYDPPIPLTYLRPADAGASDETDE